MHEPHFNLHAIHARVSQFFLLEQMILIFLSERNGLYRIEKRLHLPPVFWKRSKMNPLKEYRIPFLGLKQGKHEFDFILTEKFFEVFELSEISKSNIAVKLELEKQSTMMVAKFDLEGLVSVVCDHCGDAMEQPIESHETMVIKFGDATSDMDSEILTLGPQEFELDISQYLYEYAHLAMPARHVHPNPEMCNQQVVTVLEKYKVDTTSNTRWAELKNLNYEDPEDNPEFDEEE